MHVAYTINHGGHLVVNGSSCKIIDLDNEDLEYLYNKYSKKLKEEMNAQIAEINNKYKSNINN